MGMLDRVEHGPQSLPPRLLLYGTEGIGKSTYGASAPAPVFVQTEDGLGEIGCARFPLARSFDEVLAALEELRTGGHEFQTVVIDSLDWAERLAWDGICRKYGVDSIEKAAGGYGKGYIEAANLFRRMLETLDALRRERGMVAILIAHAKVEAFTDPEEGVYDRYSPRLHKHANALVTEWCDIVAFATRRITIQNAHAGDVKIAKNIGAGGGERILRCEGGPSCVAKNRYNLPSELPLAWSALMDAMVGPATEEVSPQAEKAREPVTA